MPSFQRPIRYSSTYTRSRCGRPGRDRSFGGEQGALGVWRLRQGSPSSIVTSARVLRRSEACLEERTVSECPLPADAVVASARRSDLLSQIELFLVTGGLGPAVLLPCNPPIDSDRRVRSSSNPTQTVCGESRVHGLDLDLDLGGKQRPNRGGLLRVELLGQRSPNL